jgi:hypothetical protein
MHGTIGATSASAFAQATRVDMWAKADPMHLINRCEAGFAHPTKPR